MWQKKKLEVILEARLNMGPGYQWVCILELSLLSQFRAHFLVVHFFFFANIKSRYRGV